MKQFTVLSQTEPGGPLVHYVLQSFHRSKEKPWPDIFQAVQLAFVEATVSGPQLGFIPALTLCDHNEGYVGKSPRFASFYVFKWVIKLEPEISRLSFGI